MSRQNICFVAVKSVQQKDGQDLHRIEKSCKQWDSLLCLDVTEMGSRMIPKCVRLRTTRTKKCGVCVTALAIVLKLMHTT